MSFESVWDLIPVKLFFLILFVYLSYHFVKKAKASNKALLVYYFFFVSGITVVLSIESLKKIYPYGVIFDLSIVLFLSYIAIWFESKISNLYLRRSLVFLTFSLMVLLPLFYIQHKFIVGDAVNADSFIAIFQTNYYEALEYVYSFTSLVDLILILLVFLGLYWVTHINTKSEPISFGFKGYVAALLVFMVLLVVPFERGLYNFPVYVFQNYQKELNKLENNVIEASEQTQIHSEEVKKTELGETYVLVIGESLNKHHMSLYGYHEETTPHLDKLQKEGELLVFKNSYSNYPNTIASLSMALTNSNQKMPLKMSESIGVVDVFNAAGFETAWLGNQPLNNSFHIALKHIAQSANDVHLTFDTEFHVTYSEGQKPDGVLLPVLQELLQKNTEKNRFIVVHLMGSHTSYCQRYPHEFEKFKMTWFEQTWMRLTKGGVGHSLSCYDNSVLYNDFVVSEIINLVANVSQQRSAAVLYFADHGEDVVRGKGHSSANFSYAMVDSPAVLWLSPNYKQRYSKKYMALKANSEKLFPNDFVFDTVIGLAGVTASSRFFCEDCDISQPSYDLPSDKAYTMHGQMVYKIDK